MIEGRATAKYVRTSAQKAKLVIDLIRGKDVDNALATLRFARKGIAKDVEKVLRSAIANAQQKEGADEVERLYVRACYANQGPTLKRIRAAPMGRAFRILKRTSHLTVIVEERPEGQVSRSRRARGGSDGTGGAGGGPRRRRAAVRAPVTTPEPEVPGPDTTPEVETPRPGTPPEPETDLVPEVAEPEPETAEPTESDVPPEPEDESDTTPEPEQPEPEEHPEPDKPDEPDEEPPTLPPGGILGIR